MIKKLSLVLLLSCAIAPHSTMHAMANKQQRTLSANHLSEKYKSTINLICDISHPDDVSNALKTLAAGIDRDGVIGSIEVVRTATRDALALLKKAQPQFVESHFSVINDYLKNYQEALNDSRALDIMTANNDQPADVRSANISDENYK